MFSTVLRFNTRSTNAVNNFFTIGRNFSSLSNSGVNDSAASLNDLSSFQNNVDNDEIISKKITTTKHFRAIDEDAASKLWPQFDIWQPPRMTPEQRTKFEATEKFYRDDSIYVNPNSPLSVEDVGKFQLFARDHLSELLPEGLAGDMPKDITMITSRTSPIGMMVRKPTVELLHQMEHAMHETDAAGRPCISKRGFFIDGHRGSGKSYLLNHAVAWARQNGWMVMYERDPRKYLKDVGEIKRSASGLFMQPQFTQAYLERVALANKSCLERIPVHKASYGCSALDGTHKKYAIRAYNDLIRRAVESELDRQDEEAAAERGNPSSPHILSESDEAYLDHLKARAEKAFFKPPPKSDPRLKFLAVHEDLDVEDLKKAVLPGHEIRSHTRERRLQIEEAYRKKMEEELHDLQSRSGRSEIDRERERIRLWQEFSQSVKPIDISSELKSPQNLWEIVELGLHNDAYAVSAAYELNEQLKKQREFPLLIAVDKFNECFPVSRYASQKYENTVYGGWVPGFHLTMPRLFHKFDGGEYVRGLKIVSNSFQYRPRKDQNSALWGVKPEEMIQVKNFSAHEFSNYVAYLVRKKVLKHFPRQRLEQMYMASGGNGWEARHILARLY